MAYGDATLQEPPVPWEEFEYMDIRATPELDEELLGRIAAQQLDAHLQDEDDYRREEERMSA